MKFTVSIPSLIAHTSSILFLSFSLPLLAQITVPDKDHECKILTQQTFDSAKNFLKIAEVPKSCFTYMIDQHHRAILSQERMKYYDQASAYEKSGEKQKAISNWTKYIGDRGSGADDGDFFISFEPYFRRANLYRDLGDKENAIKDYKVADRMLQQDINGVNGNAGIDSISNLNKVRAELSQLGVSLREPQFETANTLRKIANMEVERALNLARLKPQHPLIQDLDTQLQGLYEQLANAEPQALEGTEKTMISNAAYRKMEDFKKERSQLIKSLSPNHPKIVSIDKDINQLEELIRRNRK